jgi:hypothetical protein
MPTRSVGNHPGSRSFTRIAIFGRKLEFRFLSAELTLTELDRAFYRPPVDGEARRNCLAL